MWARALVVMALLPALSGSAASTPVPAWGPPVLEGQLKLADETTELRTADLNGDGLRDVIIGPLVYERLDPVPPAFLLNKGGGRFVEATDSLFDGPVPKIEWNREMVVADFNGDGRPDIFIADNGLDNQALNPGYPGQQDRLILSTPDGKYTDATANLPQQRSFTHSAAATDVNGDGHVDIFENNLGCCGRDHVPAEILLNDGSGHFTAAPGLLDGFPMNQYGQTYSLACAFADVNGDGRPDLIVGGDEQIERSAALLNDDQGNFTFFEWLPPKLSKPGVGNSVQQILAALNSGNGQGGRDGYALFNEEMALYGPNVELAGEQSGDRRENDSGGGRGRQVARLSSDAQDPALARPEATGRVRLQPDGKFPLRYRELVGEYFRAVGETAVEEGGRR